MIIKLKYYLFIFLTLLFFFSGIKVRPQSSSEIEKIDAQGEEGIFTVYYFNIVKNDITTYFTEGKLYFSLFELFDILKINYSYDYEEKIISGFFVNMDSIYQIDLKRYQIRLKNRIVEINDTDVVILTTGFFFTAEFLNKIFPLQLDVRFNKLQLLVKTRKELPVLLEFKRKKSFTFLNPAKDELNNYSPLLYDRERSWLNLGIIEYRANATYSNQQTSFDGTFNSGFEILGGDFSSSFNLYYRQSEKDFFYFFEPRWRYFFSDNGYLNQITVGDINNISIRSTNLPIYKFKGISLSNEGTKRPMFFDNIKISDRIKPGWQVELFKNGQLVGQTISDPLGYFEFQLPLNYGNSNVELKYYGPTGEIISKRDIIQIPLNFLKPFEIRYTFDIGKENFYDGLFGNTRISIGLTDWLTTTLNVKYSELSKNYNFRTETSLRLFNNTIFTVNFYHKELLRGIIDIWSDEFGSYRYTYTRNFGKNEFFSYNLISSSELNISLPKIINGFNMLSIGRFNEYDTYYFLNSNFSLYWYFNLFNVTANYYINCISFKNSEKKDLFHKINFNIGYNILISNHNQIFGSSNIKLQAEYDISNSNFRYLGSQYNQQIAKNYSLSVSLNYDFYIKSSYLHLAFYANLDVLRSRSSYNLSRNSNSLSSDLNGIMAIGSNLDEIIFSNLNFSSNYGSAAAKVRVFLDNNSNLKYDEGEELLPNVRINISDANTKNLDNSSIRYAFSLIPYSRYNVKLDPKSIKNPNFVPKFTEFSFIADPNVIKPIDIPVLVTGIIEGNVLRERDGKTEGQPGVKIHIMSEDSSYHETQPVFSDGSFYKMGLMPGNYFAWVDSLQCAILDVYQQDTVKRFTVKSSKTGDFVEGLDLVLLERKPKDQKKIIIDTISTPLVPEEEIRIDTLTNGNGKQVNKKPDKKIPDDKIDAKGGLPEIQLFYKQSKWTWLSVPMQKELDKVAKYLLENPNAKAHIDGHSDNFGSMDDNMKISEQRAKEVVGYLYRKGIPLTRLYSSAHGALYPIGDNKTEQGRAKNRRVEVKIIE